MIEKFINTLCKTIITQCKLPRKGSSVILFILSSIAIAVNKCIFHYTIAPKGSILLQLFYGLWIYSVMAIPVRAYHEYCDKKDAQKKEKEEKQKAKENIDHYMEMFNLCDTEEQTVLVQFYYQQLTSIRVKNVAVVRAMKNKGIDLLSFDGSFSDSGKALTSTTGLKLITHYFDKQKPDFFEILNSLDEKEIKLLKDFINLDDEQITLYKKEVKTAKSIINKFQHTKFNDIYIDNDGFFTIPTLYLAYLHRYFSEDRVKIETKNRT